MLLLRLLLRLLTLLLLCREDLDLGAENFILTLQIFRTLAERRHLAVQVFEHLLVADPRASGIQAVVLAFRLGFVTKINSIKTII